MKQHLTHTPIILLFAAIVSCGKNTEVVPQHPQLTATVRINGADYPIVSVGDQQWTAANYAGEGGINLEPHNQKPEYGRYYTQRQAKAIVLPTGWRLPAAADFEKLCLSQGIKLVNDAYYENGSLLKKLMSKTGWTVENGTNSSGMDLYPSGYMYYTLEVGQGTLARYWTSDGQDRLQTYFSISRSDKEVFNAKLRSVVNEEWIPLRFVRDVN